MLSKKNLTFQTSVRELVSKEELSNCCSLITSYSNFCKSIILIVTL